MKKANAITRTYDYDGTYMVDVVTTDDYYEAWLYNILYGIKTSMFGVPKSQQSYREFLDIVVSNIDEYIALYVEDVEDYEGRWCDNCVVDEEDAEDPVVSNIQEEIVKLFDRTFNNCLWYKGRDEEYSLANEIGVLRGIAYCMEVVGLCPHTDEFLRMIDIQEELKSRDQEGK